MMPVVTVPSRPNGEPIAIAWSPGSSVVESPSSSGFRPPLTAPGSTFRTARSLDGSWPIRRAGIGSGSPPITTWNWFEPSTTWSLVTMWPSLSRTKPEPVPVWPAWMKTTPGETRL